MSTESKREVYFSFFMFTADLRPEDTAYTQVLVDHLKALSERGYAGFDMRIAPRAASVKHELEVDSYRRLKKAFDQEPSLKDKKFATNVGTTRFFDPTSPYEEQRKRALSYLKSRVKITSVLNGESGEAIMSGPFLYPYGAFPLTDLDQPIWSDDLQEWMTDRYQDWMKCRSLDASSLMQELAEYADKMKVKLALEPVKNWETPPPNMVSELLDFLNNIGNSSCGITLDTAQIVMESQGPNVFRENLARAVREKRLNYVHISAPDRGAIRDNWIPWDIMLPELERDYKGPYLIEVFNAIPPFDSSMRMTRPRFWRPGEDAKGKDTLSAYEVASDALEELRDQIACVRSDRSSQPATHADDA